MEENLRNIVFRRGTELINICSAEKPFSWPATLAEETTTFNGKMKNDEFLANLPNCQKFLNGETNLFQNLEISEREAQVKESALLRAKLFRQSSSSSDRLFGKFLTSVAVPNMSVNELNEPTAGPSVSEDDVCSEFVDQMKKMGHSMESIVNKLLNKKPEGDGFTLVTGNNKRAKLDTASNPVQLQNRFEGMGEMDTSEPQEGTPEQPALLRAIPEQTTGQVPKKYNLARTKPAQTPKAVEPTQTKQKKARIPPIRAYNLNSLVLDQLVKAQKVPVNYKIRMGARNSQTIFCGDEPSHKVVTDIINNSNAGGHSYPLQSERTSTRVLKGVPYEFGEEAVAKEIKEKSGKSVSVKLLKTSKAKREGYQLNMYLVNGPNEDIDEVTKLTGLFYHKITWDRLKKSDISQCGNCFRFGHSAPCCYNEPRCIKCPDRHNAWECTKPKKDEPNAPKAFCVNCQDFGHPATYRKCPIRLIKLEEIENKRSSKQQQIDERHFNLALFPQLAPQHKEPTRRPQAPRPSHADVVRGHQPTRENQQTRRNNAENPMDYLEKECGELFKFDLLGILERMNEFLPKYEGMTSKAGKQKMLLNFFMSVCRTN